MIDTNVLLNVLFPEGRPFTDESANIFHLIKTGKMEGALSTQSIIDAAYIASQSEGRMVEVFRRKAWELYNYINIEGMDSFSVRDAILNCTGDFEDDAQYAFAYNNGCDIIVTGDAAFRKRYEGEGPIRFFTPAELISKMVTD